MMSFVKTGFKAALRQPFAVLSLFVYELLWGFFLYRYVQSIVSPLLHRYPGSGLPPSASQLFFAEGQFRITKTDLLEPYLWTLAGMLAFRMLLTPLMNAAVFFSLHRTDLNAGYRFFKGMKSLGVPYTIYYAILLLLTAAPLPWLVEIVKDLYEKHYLGNDFILALLPYVLGYLLYLFLLQLMFMYVQFGKATGVRLAPTLLCWAGNGHRIIMIALLIGLISLLAGALAMTVSYVWAGLTALIIYQVFPLIRMFLKVWSISVQHELWREKVNA